jgi:lisH domain-containing protein FOPNL
MIDDNVSSDNDLQSAVKEALNRQGVLKNVKARLRAEIFNCLEDKTVPLPEKKSKDVYLAAELVRELLESLGLQNSLSVFSEEIGQSTETRCDPQFLAGELGFNITAETGTEQRKDSIPLLVQLVHHMRVVKDKYNLEIDS